MESLKSLIALEISAKAAFEAAHTAMQKVADMADSGDEWAIRHLVEYSTPALQKASGNYARIQRRLDELGILIAS